MRAIKDTVQLIVEVHPPVKSGGEWDSVGALKWREEISKILEPVYTDAHAMGLALGELHLGMLHLGTGVKYADLVRAAVAELGEARRRARPNETPVPMRIPCPDCGELHIDEGEFETKPHHTHSCQHCGLTWRPAVVATVGVRFLPGFKNP